LIACIRVGIRVGALSELAADLVGEAGTEAMLVRLGAEMCFIGRGELIENVS
jgi:hypothetical protein